MTEFQMLLTYTQYVRARMYLAKHDERGASAVEWLIIVLAIITIAGLAITFITNYVNKKGTQLNNQP